MLLLFAWSLLCSPSSLPCLSYLPHNFLHTLFVSSSLLLSLSPLPCQFLVKQGELEGMRPSVSSWASPSFVFLTLHSANIVHSVSSCLRQASLDCCVSMKTWATWWCLWGYKFHSDFSIVLMKQLLTLVNLNKVLLYSCQTASGKHWIKLFFLLISEYWGTVLPWSHLPWAVCHNMTLLMQGGC